MMNRIKDQIVFLTGATGGIGEATAVQLCEAGAKLAISGRNAEKLEALQAKLPGETFVAAADVTDESQVAQAIAKAGEHFGHLDSLINMPGLSIPGPLVELAVEDFQRMFDVNVKSMFLCSKHFLKQVDAERGGLIVNISSVAGKSANPNAPVYCMGKAAMNMLSDGFSLQCKQANVRVSLLSPGAVSTVGFWGDRKVPHEKFLKPADVAEVIAFTLGLPAHVLVQDVVFQPWDFFKSK